MKLRFYVLWFSLLIFVLAAVGTVAFYIRQFILSFWLKLALLIAYPCVLAIFVPLLTGDGKFTTKKILLLTTSITITAIAVTNLVLIVVTPKWSFSVTTDKSSYEVGEDVKITVSIKNLGFIAHSFESAISDPAMVSIEHQYQVWYSPFQRSITEFSIGPKESLETILIWNQTKLVNIQFGEEIEPGSYVIEAFTPRASSFHISSNPLFYAETSINITSP